MTDDVRKVIEGAAQTGAKVLQQEIEGAKETAEEVCEQQAEAIGAATARAAMVFEENRATSERKIALPHRVFGILCIVVGVVFLPIDAMLLIAFVQSLITKDWSTFFEVTVANQFLVLSGVGLAAYAAETVLFMVLGIRLVRNKRRGAARLSQALIWVAIADFLLDIMGHGLGWTAAWTAATIVYLVVMYTTLDPALREERILQRKLKALEDKADQEEGTLGRDKTGVGYLKLDFFNIFWLFVIASVVGLAFESAVCPFLNGRIENRTGMLWGPFSPIYGVGAVLMVIALNRFWKSSPVIIFVVSGLIGGGFEYLVSWFFQFAFGISAWDYSGEPFNIDGRTDLFHMVCWGVLGLVFIKFVVPKVLGAINKIPWNWRYGVTTAFTVFMAINAGMTMMSFECWYSRIAGGEITTPVEQFFNTHYDDAFMSEHFATMSIDPSRATRG